MEFQRERKRCSKEEGDVVRESTNKAMHEDKGKNKVDKETRVEVSRKRKREGEEGEDETVAVKRRCINPVSAEAFDIVSHRRTSESCGNSLGDFLG